MRDPLYLFACLLAWRFEGNLGAFQEVLAGLDDAHPCVRMLAESMLHRPSPRPAPKLKTKTLIPLMKVEDGGPREGEIRPAISRVDKS